MSTPLPTYALVTPARNEADNIERTLRSMIAQTVKPVKWAIVSDGSTDGTDDIVRPYAAEHTWIELIRAPERKERHFAGKVHTFNVGYARLKEIPSELVGNLDADLSFEPDFFEFLLRKFATCPKLGLAGAPFVEENRTYDFRFSSTDHVSGACQIFRREAYEAIGGYTPVKGGGIDVIAVLSVRMKGWETRTFTEKHYVHHRKMGTATEGAVMAKFRDGQKDYSLGAHPLWEVFRVGYQMTRRPFLIGGCALMAGYLWLLCRRVQRPMAPEIVRFRRQDQMRRLRRFLHRALTLRSSDPSGV
jgi:glycosyltransferase involved in cell wall biosynthesis